MANNTVKMSADATATRHCKGGNRNGVVASFSITHLCTRSWPRRRQFVSDPTADTIITPR
jgi:hypothetical protein